MKIFCSLFEFQDTMYAYGSSKFGCVVFFKGRCESVSHMDEVHADIAGANICPWKHNDSIPAANTLAKHPKATIPCAMGIYTT